MGTNAQTAHKKKALLEALEKSLGVVTTACKSVDVPRRTFYLWKETDPEFAARVDEMHEIALDFAESQLHQKIKSGSDTAIIFYLKTQGKKRGYVERTEYQSVGGIDIVVESKEDADLLREIEEIGEGQTEG